MTNYKVILTVIYIFCKVHSCLRKILEISHHRTSLKMYTLVNRLHVSASSGNVLPEDIRADYALLQISENLS